MELLIRFLLHAVTY